MSSIDWGNTPRGFSLAEREFADYEGSVPRKIQVQQSSLATENKLWVGPNGVDVQAYPGGTWSQMERMHLGVDDVRWLRDALTDWLEAAT